MRTLIARIAPVTAVALVAATILAFAAPAGALDPFTPELQTDVADTEKVAVEAVAPLLVEPAPKRVTPIPVAEPNAPAATLAAAGPNAPKSGGGSREAQARAILARLIAKYPILAGTTVEFGNARGYQAVAYYRSGRIVISPNHTASLSRILNHEIWHIIDYRDNGRIDWGENVPPRG